LRLAFEHLACSETAMDPGQSEDGPMLRFLQVLERARSLECSNPRDKVYGLLGLSNVFKESLPDPDYNKTAVEVFTDLAKAFLARTNSLDVLNHAGAPLRVSRPETEDRPSWVPYWADLPVIGSLPKIYKASRDSSPEFYFSWNGEVSHVKGKVFDHIQRLSLANPGAYAYILKRLDDRIPGWCVSCDMGTSLSTYPTGDLVEEALWRTLCWNIGFDFRSLASKETGESFQEWYRIISSANTTEGIAKRIWLNMEIVLGC